MNIHLGSDHAGFSLKETLIEELTRDGFSVTDHGAHALDPDDDYPAFCVAAAQAVIADPGSLGVVIGGSGNGEQIAANKVKGIRAALLWSNETARLAREHNDANVAAVGARTLTREECVALVMLFVRTPFSGDPRHVRRITQVADYEGGTA